MGTPLMQRMLTIWRRRILVGAIVVVCCVTAFVEALSAARLALLPVVGPIGSRLVLAAVFLAVAGLCVWLLARSDAAVTEARSTPADEAKQADTARAGMLAEALHAGMLLGRGLREGLGGRSRARSEPAAEPPPAAPVDDPTRAPPA